MADRRFVVQVDVDGGDAELAADALWQAGPSAVLVVDLDHGRVRLTADVADPSLVDPAWAPVLLEVDDDRYLDAWRTWAAPIRAGRRVVLQPAWLEPAPADPDDLLVRLDPGRAFGSGSHETTRLAVAALEDVVRPGDTVLDVGCGSGVLAVVACCLGASVVRAVDVDPAAVDATRANGRRNGVADRIEADTADLAAVDATFDVVVANIGGPILFDLAAAIAARAAPAGRLVLTGVVEERLDPLAASFPGWREEARTAEAGWGLLVLRRGSPGSR